jgi:periplasmic divalent cation tolerance protein
MEIQIQVTAPDQATAQKIATHLVEHRLAACVQILGPISSTYWWEGKLESSEEYLLLVKSTAARYKALEKAVVDLHPYEVPELIGMEIKRGLPAYLNWINEETGG